MSKRYTVLDLKNGDGEVTHTVIHKDGVSMSNRDAVRQLNDLEDYRVRKNKEIARFRIREEKYQSVISGMMSLIELYLNDELWWDKE